MTNKKETSIWKFTLKVEDEQRVKMPRGARILSLQVQQGQVQCWAQVEPAVKDQERIIQCFGTGSGYPIPPAAEREFIGTIQWGPLVFHFFELVTR